MDDCRGNTGEVLLHSPGVGYCWLQLSWESMCVCGRTGKSLFAPDGGAKAMALVDLVAVVSVGPRPEFLLLRTWTKEM